MGVGEAHLVSRGNGGDEVKSVEASPLTARGSHTSGWGSQVGPRASQVKAIIAQLIKGGLELLCSTSKKDDISGRTVHIGHAATMLVADITYRSQSLCRIEPARGVVHTHSMEVRDIREFLWVLYISTDNSPAITLNTNDTTMLP